MKIRIHTKFLLILCAVVAVCALWTVPAQAVEYDWDAYEAQVDQILDPDIISGMAPVELALYIHDQLILRYSYDLDNNFPETHHSAYGLLVNGAAVCGGFAEAYQDLMTRVGIPCVTVTSHAMNHAWNMIQIDGDWYHVDVTWDEPARGASQGGEVHGLVFHDYFMMSDAKAEATRHQGWTRTYDCTNTRFDSGAYWEDVEGQFCFLNGRISFHLEYGYTSGAGFINAITARVYRMDHTTGAEACVYENVWRSASVSGIYSAVPGIAWWDGSLYIANNAQLFGICPITGESWSVYTHDPAMVNSGFKGIYSFHIRDGIAYITTRDWAEIRDSYTVALSSDSHNTQIQTVAPTCQAPGGTKLSCSCGESLSLAQTAVQDHSYKEGAVLLDPTFDQPGIREAVCSWCAAETQLRIPSLRETGCPFTDVPQDQFYYPSVLWAVYHSITNGTSETLFSPNATCTRAQVATFLWRAFGCPEPSGTATGFTDVPDDTFYTKAVAWAVEQGITNGTTPTTFSPDAPCTRSQVATFLWRAAGMPQGPASNPFRDVAPGSFYYDAVLWAVSEGITNGTAADAFSPDTPCTRGQIVTFLYRYMGQ